MATYQGLDDRELVLAYKAGDEEAYDEIFRRYKTRVEVTCTRLVGYQDAEEATQETFIRALQALPRFNGQFYLSAWLTRIATNVCVDHLRARSRTNLIVLPEVPEQTIVESGPEEVVGITSPRFEKTISEVQPSHAEALALRALAGMSHTEMANRLAMSPQQVKALLHRARSSFKKAWERAEGWLLAPVFALRGFFDEKSSNTGPSVAGASPMLTSMTVERVATSVLIVATALSAVPASLGSPAAVESFGHVKQNETVDPRPIDIALDLDRSSDLRPEQADTKTADASAELLPLPPLLIDPPKQNEASEDSANEDSDSGDQPAPGGAESREALRKARDTARKTLEQVGHI